MVTDNAVKVSLIYCNKEKLIKVVFLSWEGRRESFPIRQKMTK